MSHMLGHKSKFLCHMPDRNNKTYLLASSQEWDEHMSDGM